MKRLTVKHWQNLDPWECCGQDNYCMRPSNKPGGCRNGCIVPKLYSRLAQYEDTGLSPKEIYLLQSAPAADAVPVIRCRDCIHRQGDEYPMCMLHTEPCANAIGYKGEAVCVDMDDFCSYGKRKEENNA